MNEVNTGALWHLLEGLVLMLGSMSYDFIHPILRMGANEGFGGFQAMVLLWGICKVAYGIYIIGVRKW